MGEAAFGDTLTVQSEDQPEGELLLPMSLMAAASTAAAIPPVSRSLDVPGATETFTFTLTEAKKVYFDSLTDRRSEEHTSELQSLMRISYAVFCLQKKKNNKIN